MIDVREFIPNPIVSGILGNKYPVKIADINGKYLVEYESTVSNHIEKNVGKRRRFDYVPRYIKETTEFYEIMGLLQGEMSKTQRGPLTFCNSEIELMNKVLDWFHTSGFSKYNKWHWYIKLNLKEDDMFVNTTESYLLEYWLTKSNIHYGMVYTKSVSYMSMTKNQILKNKGTLIIERRGPIFVQTIQNLVRSVTENITKFNKKYIIAYMRGIVAAEACINFNLKSRHKRVFVTACKHQEREVFMECLDKLEIQYKECKPIKDIVISRRENLEKLAELDLMSLNPTKHKKFEEMMMSYL